MEIVIALKFFALIYSVIVTLKATEVWGATIEASNKKLAPEGTELSLSVKFLSFCVCMAYANLPTIWLFSVIP